jgi:hypothetical protein
VQSDELLCATAIATGRMLQIRNFGENSAEDHGLRSARKSEPLCDKKSEITDHREDLQNLQGSPWSEILCGIEW